MAAHRILHVLGTADRTGKAICQIVENLAAGVNPERYEIEVCFLRCGEFTNRFGVLGIKSTCVDWSGAPTSPIGAARYAKLLLSSKFDLIHQHTGGRFLTQMSRTLTNARIVRHVHGRASEETGVVPKELDLPARDVTIASSRIVADSCGDPKAVVIYPGINVGDFLCERAPCRNMVVGTACRLEPVKGLRFLIEAIAILAREYPSIRLEIAGDGSRREELMAETSRLGISGNVSFLGWREDLSSVFASWEVFVLPSLDEGFGVAALEAMAASLPVIASSVGGLSELVANQNTGILVGPGDKVEIANAIRELIQQDHLRQTMGSAGHQRAKELFSVNRMVEQTIEVYDKLLLTGTNTHCGSGGHLNLP
jgi:glycosyltransferase involved in cell wall biosynthesis